jgi:hypothetical protein
MKIETWALDQRTGKADTVTVVVDGKDMCPGKSDEEVLNPRQQVEILQKLVKIQEHEDWDTWVLFNGEPLRQVEHGGDFMGVRVFFSPTPPQRIPTLLECVKVLKAKKRDTLLVTNDETLESRARELGAFSLRADSLKKGYEALFTTRGRPQSRLMRHRTVDRKKSELYGEDDDQRAIRDMIDLVDDE